MAVSAKLAAVACIWAACLTADTASAQSPKAVRLIVPVPAGAAADFTARLMAEQIGKEQGLSIVVENRPGATGMIGAELVSRSTPDGSTLLLTPNTYLIES